MSGRERPTVMLYTYTLTAMQVHTPKQRQKHTRNLDITQSRYIGFGIGLEHALYHCRFLFSGEYAVRYFLPDGVFFTL